MMLRRIVVLLLAFVLVACTPELIPRPVTPGPTLPPPTSTPVPLSAPVVTSPGLAKIAMLDEHNGWGISDTAILRTTDGGATWYDLTPQNAGKLGFFVASSFVDSQHAWILVPDQNDMLKGTLFRTSDGGESWDYPPVPFGGGDLRFLDAKHGWMMASLGAGAGSMGVAIYQTNDGGSSWTDTYTNDPNVQGAGDSLPLGGIGTVPGVLVGIGLMIICYVLARRRGYPVSSDKFSIRKVYECFKGALLGITAMAIILGGILTGIFTPTEAGAVGAFGALVLGLAKRKMSFSGLWEVLLETGITTAGIFFLLISAQMYSRMLALSGLVDWTAKYVISLQLPPLAVIGMFIVVWLILGCLIDSASIMLLTLPLMIPIVKALGYSLIWFGVVSVIEKNCTGCHKHNKGFGASCTTCHGYPPTDIAIGGPNGLA